MKNLIAIVMLALLFLFSASDAPAQQNILVYGTVTYASDGSPAASVKLRLLEAGNEKASTYADSRGSYGFLNIAGNPADYSIEIENNGKVVKTIKPEDLKAIARGGRLDIKLD